MKEGDAVQFTAEHVRRLGHEKRWADARGEVVCASTVTPHARIRWSSGPWAGSVKTIARCHLEPADRPALP